jgi:5-formyltetrahydrofolate cyclo-ligase
MLDISEAKRELRQTMRRHRRLAAPELGRVAGERLHDGFMAALDPPPGSVVAAYWPLPDEMDTRPLLLALHDRGCVCALPTVARPDAPLIFRRWRPGDELRAGPHGIQEPHPDKEELLPQLIALPLLAVDGNGFRLGAGGGYYDRTLAQMRARESGLASPPQAVGVAFSFQVLDTVPHGRNDQVLDWVVTEGDAIRFA